MTDSKVFVLAGDLGGTKTRLGVFAVGEGGVGSVSEGSFVCSAHSGLGEIVAEFLGGSDLSCASACFGVAGPVTSRQVRVTNLPWVVDADALVQQTAIASIFLINDLEATGWGVTALAEDGAHVLNPGRPDAVGNGAVIAAGTGLGEAGIYWDGETMRPFGCEGGHTSFSPSDEVGDGFLRFLRRRHETVSWERVLSGPGLADLYRYMLEDAGQSAPDWFVEAEAAGDPSPAVSGAGLEGRCDVATAALTAFARFYGEEAGNLALKVMATGGVWVGGGIAPKILPVFEAGSFMEGFLAKGRMRPLLESMPVKIVLDDRAALVGAARFAAMRVV